MGSEIYFPLISERGAKLDKMFVLSGNRESRVKYLNKCMISLYLLQLFPTDNNPAVEIFEVCAKFRHW